MRAISLKLPDDASYARRILISAAIPACAFLVYSSLRLAWADHLSRASDAETIGRAVAWSPGDADLRLKLAALEQAGGADPAPALLAAARLDPMNAEVRIRLGLVAELRGNLPAAEDDLLEAARRSRQFAPRWTLANYYFRRGDQEQFWRWARESLLLGYGEVNPVFQLCWNMRPDAAFILERVIPDRRDVLSSYLGFLVQERRLAASGPVARKLAPLATKDDQRILSTYCDWQIEAGSTPAAVDVWNTLCNRRLLPYAPLDPARAPLTDGSFNSVSGDGFAWRIAPGLAVTIGRNPSPRYLWINFSGDQPETCEPLLQYIPVTPGASYRFGFQYHTSELPAASGLRWRVSDGRTGADLAPKSPWLSSTDWKPAEIEFRAPASGLVCLRLSCQRQPGATRIEGDVELRHASVERLP